MIRLLVAIIACFLIGCGSSKHLYSSETNAAECDTVETCTHLAERAVLHNWKRPNDIGSIYIELKIKIDKFLEVSEVNVIESTGNSEIDNSFVAAAFNSSPFNQFKELSAEDTTKIEDIHMRIKWK